MKRLSVLTAVLVATGFAAPALAGGINLNGPHYNLNIIGVENPKTAPMTGSDRHTIFVGLGKKSSVTSNIYLAPGPFDVCDGNAFDAAHSCTGDVIANQGAVFQLPCDSAVPTASGCPGGTFSADYQIWGRALGKPGGSVSIKTCGTDDTGALVCSTGSALFTRGKGKSGFFDVTTSLTTVNACFDVAGVVTCETISLFDPDLQDYFWQYSNNGLRLLQLRFYPL
ncbi:MAG: hypothetical protein E6H50_01865 [Betaproteobacteria bacterium]|nr:MAG: hypothetical protein E6H50_01865 [Betaproteobacteria bacterium]